MNKTITLSSLPLLQTTENFLTVDECKKLILVAELNLYDSTVINGITGLEEISDYRTSSNYDLPYDHELTHIIYERISNTIDIDSDRFEKIEIIKYENDDQFDHHVDYFISTTEKKHFSKGGQRVGTVILYLNDVESGGETFFSRLRIIEQPKIGKMIYFKYDYTDDINVKTTHKGMPVGSEEKWIATVWIRQYPITQIFENYDIKNNVEYNDTVYELECITTDDIRTLNLTLYGNYQSNNTIMVKVTSTSDSFLLLYIITCLNLHQQIPYFILPIIVGDYTDNQVSSMIRIIDNIRNRTSSEYLLNSEIFNSNHSLISIFEQKSLDKFYKFSYIYVSDVNLDINDSEFFINPFVNLQEYHLMYAINELNIDNLLNLD